jgi:hypothetical protein
LMMPNGAPLLSKMLILLPWSNEDSWRKSFILRFLQSFKNNYFPNLLNFIIICFLPFHQSTIGWFKMAWIVSNLSFYFTSSFHFHHLFPWFRSFTAKIKSHPKDLIKSSSTTRDDHFPPKWKTNLFTSPIYISTKIKSFFQKVW